MELDNLTILYIILALSIVQFLLMRYYVASSLETEIHQNNKRLVKRMTGQIQSTLQQHLGATPQPNGYEREVQNEPSRRRPPQVNRYKEPEQPTHTPDNDVDQEADNQMDSMDDPVGADDDNE